MKPTYLPEVILGERIVLRKNRVDMAEVMFRQIDEDRERLGKFLPWVQWTRGVHDERDYIEMTLKQWEEFKMFDYGLFLQNENTYLGNIGVHSIQWEHNCAELGYWILGKFEGQGYVSEGVKALEKVLFNTGFFRIEIRCSGSNSKSCEVAKRCGYTLEGRLRQHRIENGQRRDTLIYSKLKNEA